MHLRFFGSAIATLCATSFSTAQEGTTPAPQSTPTPAVSRPGEAPAPASKAGERSHARIVPTGIVENLPIPAVRPEFDLTRHGLPGRDAGTERWNLTFYQRNFDLSEFRNAIYTDAPVETVNQIVAGLEKKMVADQAAFAAAIVGLGGRVSHQWWIINGCAVEVPRAALVLIAAIPNVATLDPDRTMEPVLDPSVPTWPMVLTSTNAANHNADAVQAKGFHGAGVAYAIVDTGQDSNMNGTGSPHIQYFLNAVKPGTSLLLANKAIGAQPADDTHGHGTGVCSIMGGNKWLNAGADFGHSHNSGKVGYSICDFAGSCSSNLSTQATAFNTIAADKATYKIVSANMSYGSSPSPTDVSQQAIDSCALNADVFIATAAGNSAANTTGSSSTANGLCVAACDATAKTIASFSCRGPLSGDAARFFPDITGCGVNTVMALVNNEAGNYVASGTSMASPQVSGAAALIRSIDTTLTALETKAILLCRTEDISAQNPAAPYNSRNAYGMGFLRDDLSADQILGGNGAITSTITGPVKTFPMPVTSAKQYAVALTWHRSNLATTTWNDLNLRVLNGAAVVASSSTTRNLYEKVVFTAAATGTFTIEVSAVGALNPNPQTFALAHTGDTDCVIVPSSAAGVMGNSNNNIPFSWTPTRYQQIVRGTEVGGATTFHHLGLRQDEAFNSSPGATVDLEIRLAQTTLTEATLTTTFATNMNAGAPVVVVPRHNVVLPNFPPTNNTNPSQFLVEIPFAAPYPWPATAGRNLIVDVTQRGNSKGNATFTYPLDAHSGATATTSRVFGFPDTATTGTLGLNYGLVLCLGLDPVGTTASYNFYGTGCAGTGPGIAQVILPAAQAAAMGNSNNAIPFSWTPTRYQQVFLGTEQTVARSYNGLGLRQDNALSVNTGGISVDLEMSLGYTTFTNATLTTTFATNFNSGAPVTVFPRQLVALPNLPAVANANPAEFFIKFPFATPFPYVPAAGRNTLIQVIQRGNTFGSDNFGYFLDADSATTSTRLYGFPDTAATGTLGVNYGLAMAFLYAGPAGAIPLLTNTGDPVIGNTFSVDVWQARPSSVAILFLGVSNTTWGFIPLPFNLAGSGAPGCFIRASGEFLFAAGTNAFGRGSFPFGIPGDSSLIGGTFYNQYAVVDAGANPLGISWTRGGVGVMGNK